MFFAISNRTYWPPVLRNGFLKMYPQYAASMDHYSADRMKRNVPGIPQDATEESLTQMVYDNFRDKYVKSIRAGDIDLFIPVKYQEAFFLELLEKHGLTKYIAGVTDWAVNSVHPERTGDNVKSIRLYILHYKDYIANA